MAISQYSSLLSMPIELKPPLSAATIAVPVPINGSISVPCGGVTSLTKYRMSSNGF